MLVILLFIDFYVVLCRALPKNKKASLGLDKNSSCFKIKFQYHEK